MIHTSRTRINQSDVWLDFQDITGLPTMLRVAPGWRPPQTLEHLPAPSRSAGAVQTRSGQPPIQRPSMGLHAMCTPAHRSAWPSVAAFRMRAGTSPPRSGGRRGLACGGRQTYGVPTKKRIRRLVRCALGFRRGTSPLHNVHPPSLARPTDVAAQDPPSAAGLTGCPMKTEFAASSQSAAKVVCFLSWVCGGEPSFLPG